MFRLCQRISRITRSVYGRPAAFSSDVPPEMTAGEERLTAILKKKFPESSFVQVQDISGGCGAMYDIQIESKDFKGKRTVMQHRMVNEALADEIKDMHGLRINTAVPSA